ncbi:hypothetical protein OIU35_18135 [Boseaceae bacterium BT-24-1]|nr:hypothetical protein [Boseaceae bacterium BT-24-1]
MAHHPDSHELDDWPECGPKNPAISNLVWQLAHDRGMRVVDIELIIERALREELAKGQGDGNSLRSAPSQFRLERRGPD